MQRVIEDVLNTNKIMYTLYSKSLSTKSQQKKLENILSKKPRHVFIVERKQNSTNFVKKLIEREYGEDDEDYNYVILRNDVVYAVDKNISEQELREEVYDDIVNCGELYICESCKEIIRSQKMKCESCEDPSYMCTFCFAKTILSNGNTKCPKCSGAFINLETKMFLDEMIELYKSNPRDLFTLLQKKKKQLPPGLKNLTKIIHSAQEEARSRGEKLDFGSH